MLRIAWAIDIVFIDIVTPRPASHVVWLPVCSLSLLQWRLSSRAGLFIEFTNSVFTRQTYSPAKGVRREVQAVGTSLHYQFSHFECCIWLHSDVPAQHCVGRIITDLLRSSDKMATTTITQAAEAIELESPGRAALQHSQPGSSEAAYSLGPSPTRLSIDNHGILAADTSK